VEAKDSFMRLIHTVLNESAYIAKGMDDFNEIGIEYQCGFIKYMASQLGREDWADWAKDETLLAKSIRTVLYHYSGNEELEQPTRKDLAKLIANFLRSPEFRLIDEKTMERSAAS